MYHFLNCLITGLISICLEPTLCLKILNLIYHSQVNWVLFSDVYIILVFSILGFYLPSPRVCTLYFKKLGFHHMKEGFHFLFGEGCLVCALLFILASVWFLEVGLCPTIICCWCLHSSHGFWLCPHYFCWQSKSCDPLYFSSFSESLLHFTWVLRKHRMLSYILWPWAASVAFLRDLFLTLVLCWCRKELRVSCGLLSNHSKYKRYF